MVARRCLETARELIGAIGVAPAEVISAIPEQSHQESVPTPMVDADPGMGSIPRQDRCGSFG